MVGGVRWDNDNGGAVFLLMIDGEANLEVAVAFAFAFAVAVVDKDVGKATAQFRLRSR